MSRTDKTWRAADAQRLLEDPILNGILRAMEFDVINDISNFDREQLKSNYANHDLIRDQLFIRLQQIREISVHLKKLANEPSFRNSEAEKFYSGQLGI